MHALVLVISEGNNYERLLNQSQDVRRRWHWALAQRVGRGAKLPQLASKAAAGEEPPRLPRWEGSSATRITVLIAGPIRCQQQSQNTRRTAPSRSISAAGLTARAASSARLLRAQAACAFNKRVRPASQRRARRGVSGGPLAGRARRQRCAQRLPMKRARPDGEGSAQRAALSQGDRFTCARLALCAQHARDSAHKHIARALSTQKRRRAVGLHARAFRRLRCGGQRASAIRPHSSAASVNQHTLIAQRACRVAGTNA